MERSSCSLFFAGDICISDKIQKNYIAGDLLALIEQHDLRIANLEAHIIKDGFKRITKAGPHIYQHDSFRYILENRLFDIYSLANNHIVDFGFEGLFNTIDCLRENNCQFVGAGLNFEEVYRPLVVQQNGLKIAFIGCCESQFGCAKDSYESSFGYAWIFSDLILKTIQKLRSEVDFIIIMPHAGLEMEDFPLPEWRRCYQTFIDYGADLVIASHPHVVQGAELYRGRYIYYSLGNFLFSSKYDDDRWNKSLALSIIISKESNQILVKEHFLKFDDNILKLDLGQFSHFDFLCKSICDQDFYYSQVDKICITAWEDYYELYYQYTGFRFELKSRFLKFPNFVKKLIIYFVNKILKRPPSKNQVLLYHNISIETHRFVVERALRRLNAII